MSHRFSIAYPLLVRRPSGEEATVVLQVTGERLREVLAALRVQFPGCDYVEPAVWVA